MAVFLFTIFVYRLMMYILRLQKIILTCLQAKHHRWIFGPNFGMVDITVDKGEQRPDITRES